jgi:hypothetical protein
LPKQRGELGEGEKLGNVKVKVFEPEEGDDDDDFPLPSSRSNSRMMSLDGVADSGSPPPPLPIAPTPASSALGGVVYQEPDAEPAASTDESAFRKSVDLRIPGSFDWSEVEYDRQHEGSSVQEQEPGTGAEATPTSPTSWTDLFKKLALSS